ncbi:MAG TPA: hypothetical protein VFZ66_22875 [Herpetosiphonaceae bacterium]
MSESLFAYLDSAPSLDEIATELSHLGLCYRHTLPADDRWDYPMHVFGMDNLRVVYHAGDPHASGAIVDATVRRGDTAVGAAQLRLIATRVVQRWGGEVYDPQIKRRVVLSKPV